MHSVNEMQNKNLRDKNRRAKTNKLGDAIFVELNQRNKIMFRNKKHTVKIENKVMWPQLNRKKHIKTL